MCAGLNVISIFGWAGLRFLHANFHLRKEVVTILSHHHHLDYFSGYYFLKHHSSYLLGCDSHEGHQMRGFPLFPRKTLNKASHEPFWAGYEAVRAHTAFPTQGEVRKLLHEST